MRGLKTGVAVALVAVLAGGGGAYAAGQITSAQIKDGTITSKDIKKGTITATNLSAAAKKGLTGARGATGAPGAPGAAGPAGPAGPQGDPAPNVFGSPGSAGAKGDKGDAGAQGAKGDTGAQGLKGDTGAQGLKGDKGDVGPAAAANLEEVSDVVPNNADDDDEWINVAVATCPDGKRVISGAFIQDVQSLGEVFVNAPDEDGNGWIVIGANWADPEGEFVDGELTSIAYCVPSPAASKAPFAQRQAAAVAEAEALRNRFNKQRR